MTVHSFVINVNPVKIISKYFVHDDINMFIPDISSAPCSNDFFNRLARFSQRKIVGTINTLGLISRSSLTRLSLVLWPQLEVSFPEFELPPAIP